MIYFFYKRLTLFFFFFFLWHGSLQAFRFSVATALWSKLDGSAVALQLEWQHRFVGKKQNGFFDLHFKLPLAFRFHKERPVLLAGIELFPKKKKVNSLDFLSHSIYLTHYIEKLRYQYKQFHIGLEPSQNHFLHNGLIVRENPLVNANFARYTPAFSIGNHQSVLHTSEASQSGLFLFYGDYRLGKKGREKSSWFFLKEVQISPVLWSNFPSDYRFYHELGLGLELSTMFLKKAQFALGLFSAFDVLYQPMVKNHAYKLLLGLEFFSKSQRFSIGTGVRSQNHSDGPWLSQLYPFRRNEHINQLTKHLPALIFFTHPRESQQHGFRFATEVYFIDVSFSYRLEYFVKKNNLNLGIGHGHEQIYSFADFKNFKKKPLYFSVAIEGDIVELIKVRWHTRYYYWQKASLSSYVSVTIHLVNRPKIEREPPLF